MASYVSSRMNLAKIMQTNTHISKLLSFRNIESSGLYNKLLRKQFGASLSCTLDFTVTQERSRQKLWSKVEGLLHNHNVSFLKRLYSSECTKCWKCGSMLNRLNEQFMCRCGVLQPPAADTNYFQVFGLPEKFNIDSNELTTKFRHLQSFLHPDKFTNKPQIERDHSAEQSSLVNKAYQTLLKPLTRGLYLLEINHESIEEKEILMDPEFLMEVMDQNEQIDSSTSIKELKGIVKKNNIIIDGLIEDIKKAFSDMDIQLAKHKLSKLKYYCNIDEKLKEKKHKIHDLG